MDKNLKKGHAHLITQTIEEIKEIFAFIGFSIASGPELETEFFNFDALNFPKNHPARDMQDTFFVKNPGKDFKIEGKDVSGEKLVMRTHTSSVQIRYMQNHEPPFSIIVPGKVFRNEATDATHEAQFHQFEGLCIGKDISLSNLKGVLEYFFRKFFNDENVSLEFRPSFFPFVEPGVEVAMNWRGKSLEIMGAGLVHPNVLKVSGVNPEEWSGFAFGGGIERLIVLKYGLSDIRELYNGDLRLVNQF